MNDVIGISFTVIFFQLINDETLTAYQYPFQFKGLAQLKYKIVSPICLDTDILYMLL